MKPGRMMPGGMNMQAMMKQAQKLQNDMMKKQEELEQMTALDIKPEAVDPEDVEMLCDLVITAVNDALRQCEETTAREMQKLTGGMNLGF